MKQPVILAELSVNYVIFCKVSPHPANVDVTWLLWKTTAHIKEMKARALKQTWEIPLPAKGTAEVVRVRAVTEGRLIRHVSHSAKY